MNKYQALLDAIAECINDLIWDGTDLTNGYTGEIIFCSNPDYGAFNDVDGYFLREAEWMITDKSKYIIEPGTIIRCKED